MRNVKLKEVEQIEVKVCRSTWLITKSKFGPGLSRSVISYKSLTQEKNTVTVYGGGCFLVHSSI